MAVYKENVIDASRALADEALQRRRWLADAGPEVSSFAEAVCQLFDDTGLSDALEEPDKPPVFSREIDDHLRQLDRELSKIDQSPPPLQIIQDRRMSAVRNAAASILAEIDSDGLAERS